MQDKTHSFVAHLLVVWHRSQVRNIAEGVRHRALDGAAVEVSDTHCSSAGLRRLARWQAATKTPRWREEMPLVAGDLLDVAVHAEAAPKKGAPVRQPARK